MTVTSSAHTFEKLTGGLADRYRLERGLGAGGMVTVYLAHDNKHDCDVAIKVLHPRARSGERARLPSSGSARRRRA